MASRVGQRRVESSRLCHLHCGRLPEGIPGLRVPVPGPVSVPVSVPVPVPVLVPVPGPVPVSVSVCDCVCVSVCVCILFVAVSVRLPVALLSWRSDGARISHYMSLLAPPSHHSCRLHCCHASVRKMWHSICQSQIQWTRKRL